MPHFKIYYPGELRTEAVHVPSQTKIKTDAPVDNLGKGEFFSPTDLVATALATCMLTTMSIRAGKQGFDIAGATADVRKVMSSDPRRIAEIIIRIDFPALPYSDEQKQLLEYTAHHCPVALSLHPDVKQTVTFHYQSYVQS